jgi:hypothetical protein
MTGKGLSTKALLSGDSDKKKGKNGKGEVVDFSTEQLEKAYGLKDLSSAQRGRVGHLIELLSAIRQCNKAKNLDEAIAIVIDATCKILMCDRATLFMVSFILIKYHKVTIS